MPIIIGVALAATLAAIVLFAGKRRGAGTGTPANSTDKITGLTAKWSSDSRDCVYFSEMCYGREIH